MREVLRLRAGWRWLSLLVLGTVLALVLAACGGGGGASGQTYTVKMSEFKFEPSTLTVKAGQPVKVTVQNSGTTVHDFTVRGLGQDVTVRADPGKSATAEFTPSQPGTYEIVCVEPGHLEAGMKGQLVVQ